MYADDCVLMNIHNINESVEPKICDDMKQIINFLNAKKLILNVKKTKFMIIHSSATKADEIQNIDIKSSDNDDFKINGEYRIERTQEMKYLGLIIDEKLNWESHVKHVESKIANATGVLWKMKSCLPQNIKKKIYKALIESHINYMIPVWGAANDSIIQSLQIVQNRALRNTYNLDRLTNRIEMYSTKVDDNLPIRAIYYKNTAGFIFKTCKRLIYTNLAFTKVLTGRRGDYLRPEATRTVIGRRRIAAIGPRMFNDLPQEIQKSKHVHGFVKSIKERLKDEDMLAMCFNGEFLSKYA